MSVQIGDNIRIGRKFMDSKGNKAGRVGIPIGSRIKARQYFPERDWTIIRIALGKKIDGMEIGSEINKISAD